MATWQNTRTGEIFDLPDEPPEDMPRADAARQHRIAAAMDRSQRWERLDLPDAKPSGNDEQGGESGGGTDPAQMTVAQLRELAKKRGVSTAGSKAELIERLSG